MEKFIEEYPVLSGIVTAAVVAPVLYVLLVLAMSM
jgi:hypothetical protein